MTYVLQAATVAQLTVPEVMELRRLANGTMALLWIKKNHPEFDKETQEDVMMMVDDVARNRVFLPTKATAISSNKFRAAAWLNGASWGQLAFVLKVSRQALARSVERLIPPDGRQSLRLGGRLSDIQVMRMFEKFNSMVDSIPPETSVIDLARMIEPTEDEEAEGKSIWELPTL